MSERREPYSADADINWQEIKKLQWDEPAHALAPVSENGHSAKDLDLSPFGFQLTVRGLVPIGQPELQSWMDCGEVLRTYHGYLMREATILQFAIGDWLAYGEKTYGETYSAAIDATGYDKDTLANFKYVARAVESSRRNENLTWSHHAAVAALPPGKQKSLLADAAAEQLSVKALRERAYAERSIEPPDPTIECPFCHNKFIP